MGGRRPLSKDEIAFRNEFASRFRKARKKAGLTQKQFSEALGNIYWPTTSQAVSLWETGRAIPDIETLFAVAFVLQTTPQRLLPPFNEEPFRKRKRELDAFLEGLRHTP
jgi:transcriptional regulator with XRE-family HTH domain